MSDKADFGCTTSGLAPVVLFSEVVLWRFPLPLTRANTRALRPATPPEAAAAPPTAVPLPARGDGASSESGGLRLLRRVEKQDLLSKSFMVEVGTAWSASQSASFMSLPAALVANRGVASGLLSTSKPAAMRVGRDAWLNINIRSGVVQRSRPRCLSTTPPFAIMLSVSAAAAASLDAVDGAAVAESSDTEEFEGWAAEAL